MAKKVEGHEKGAGPYSKNDVTFTRRGDLSGSKDIFKNITENAERTDGFSAKLTPEE